MFADSPNERAMYSLYVIGSNGDLVEHMLEPQKLTTAPDGEDAPIELTHLFKLCWKLLGYVVYLSLITSSCTIYVIHARDNPIIIIVSCIT